jgi:DNA-binding NarL/FixJ family response regulator
MEARTVAEGAALLANVPDLVVMDVRLPDGSSVEVAEASRALDPSPTVIAISGAATAAEAFELAKAGVQVFLPKPFSQGEFERRVKWALAGDGESGLPPELKAALEVNLQRLTEQHALTERQTEVIRLVIAGVPRGRFAERLGITGPGQCGCC